MKALVVQLVDGLVILVTLKENTDPVVRVDERVSVTETELLVGSQVALVNPVPLNLEQPV